MEKTNKEITNVLDLSLIDHEFIIVLLNLILEEKEKQINMKKEREKN